MRKITVFHASNLFYRCHNSRVEELKTNAQHKEMEIKATKHIQTYPVYPFLTSNTIFLRRK